MVWHKKRLSPWEKVTTGTYRLKVEGGWLIKQYASTNYKTEHETVAIGICFMPDLNHDWKVEEEER